jgi:hypothetical protein
VSKVVISNTAILLRYNEYPVSLVQGVGLSLCLCQAIKPGAKWIKRRRFRGEPENCQDSGLSLAGFVIGCL